jgi:hypothetical protein
MIGEKTIAPPTLPLLELSSSIPASRQPFDMVGEITHRVLVNYRIAPQVLQEFDLGRLEWDSYEDTAFLSVCLLRYKWLKPAWWPRLLAHRGSCDILYRLAVHARRSDRPIRAFLSLLNLNSSRLLVEAGRRFAPHKFAYSPIELLLHESVLTMRTPNTHFEADLNTAQSAPPVSSIFGSLHDAETFLLDLDGNLSISPRNTVRLQTISHSLWESHFVVAREARFDLLAPWIEEGLLEFDSVLYMANLAQAWRRTRSLVLADAGGFEL